jgi:hypothetical protein
MNVCIGKIKYTKEWRKATKPFRNFISSLVLLFCHCLHYNCKNFMSSLCFTLYWIVRIYVYTVCHIQTLLFLNYLPLQQYIPSLGSRKLQLYSSFEQTSVHYPTFVIELVHNVPALKMSPHCKEIPIYAFPEKELRGFSPNFHILSLWAIERSVYSHDRSTYFPEAE